MKRKEYKESDNRRDHSYSKMGKTAKKKSNNKIKRMIAEKVKKANIMENGKLKRYNSRKAKEKKTLIYLFVFKLFQPPATGGFY